MKPNASASGQTTRELDSAREHHRTRVIPAAKLALMDVATESLAISGAATRALAVGDLAPDFILPAVDGRPVRLHDLLGRGPVVLVFYRGGWCPYCNLHLRGFQRALPGLAEAGASLLAISPQLPDHSLSTSEKNALAFLVLSDVGNHVARSYGAAFRLPDELVALYRDFGHELARANGPTGATELPMPATFVIRPDRTIAFAQVEADYTRRADPDEVLALLRDLQPALTR